MGTGASKRLRLRAAFSLAMLVLLFGSGSLLWLGQLRELRGEEPGAAEGVRERAEGVRCEPTPAAVPERVPAASRAWHLGQSAAPARFPSRVRPSLPPTSAAADPVPVDHQIVAWLFWLSGAACVGIRR